VVRDDKDPGAGFGCELEQARDEALQEDGMARCRHVSPTPWGLAQCALPLDHEERHAYSPSEALDGPGAP